MFSGIGGFDLALQNLGHEIIGACEIDRYARQVYERHFPGVPVHHDATTLQADALPYFDMLCGGFPCQAFSVAGKKLGFDDPRGNLFFEIARIAKEKRPRYLFLENVRGLLFHDKGETIREMLRILDEVGYDAEWQVFDSKHFIPQTRERIFIIGHLRGAPSRQIFPLGDCGEINNESCKETQTEGEWVRNQNCGAIDASSYKGPPGRTVIKMVYLTQTNSNMKQRIQNRNETWTLSTRDDFGLEDNNRYRMFTPLEYERLQGFPDGWTEGLSDTRRKIALGNAVTVPVVQYIASNFTSLGKCEP